MSVVPRTRGWRRRRIGWCPGNEVPTGRVPEFRGVDTDLGPSSVLRSVDGISLVLWSVFGRKNGVQ